MNTNKHTKESLLKELEGSGIRKTGTLHIHSSMKSIGEVEGRADTVLDAFIEYMKEGLLTFPTHSWSDKNLIDGIYNPKTEPSNVGILTNFFMKRQGTIRSMHPTHSVTALGKRAEEYTSRDNGIVTTPCPPKGCISGLYEEDGQILFLGVPLTRNTFIHSIEEKLDIPDRINPKSRKIKLVYPDGKTKEIDSHGHLSSHGDISQNYDKLLEPMLNMGMAKKVKIGDATSYVVEVRPMADWVTKLLKEEPDLFKDKTPISKELLELVG